MWRWPSGAPDSHVNDCWVGATVFLKVVCARLRPAAATIPLLSALNSRPEGAQPSGDVALPVHALAEPFC